MLFNTEYKVILSSPDNIRTIIYCLNLKVVEGSPSKVIREISSSDEAKFFPLICSYIFTSLVPAHIDCTSKWIFPLTPSAHISIRLIWARSLDVGQTFGSSAHVTIWSPVPGSHLLLNELNGIRTSENSSPEGVFCQF